MEFQGNGIANLGCSKMPSWGRNRSFEGHMGPVELANDDCNNVLMYAMNTGRE